MKRKSRNFDIIGLVEPNCVRVAMTNNRGKIFLLVRFGIGNSFSNQQVLIDDNFATIFFKFFNYD